MAKFRYAGRVLTLHSTVSFTLRLPHYISGNRARIPQSSKNNAKAWLRKHPLARSLQAEIDEQIKKLGLEGYAPKDCWGYSCECELQFHYSDWITKKGQLKKIDLTRIWEVIEDAIFPRDSNDLRGLGVDDSKCIEYLLRKGFRDDKTPPYYVEMKVDFFTEA